MLDAERIAAFFPLARGERLSVAGEVDSTQAPLLAAAASLPDGSVVLSDCQRARGRKARRFEPHTVEGNRSARSAIHSPSALRSITTVTVDSSAFLECRAQLVDDADSALEIRDLVRVGEGVAVSEDKRAVLAEGTIEDGVVFRAHKQLME